MRTAFVGFLVMGLLASLSAVAASPSDDPKGGWVPLDDVWIVDDIAEETLDPSDGTDTNPAFADITRIRARIEDGKLIIEFCILAANSNGNLKFAVFVDWGTGGDPPAEDFDYEELLSTQEYDYHLQRQSDKGYFEKVRYFGSEGLKAESLEEGDTSVEVLFDVCTDGGDLFTCEIPLGIFPNRPGGEPTRISVITQSHKDAPPFGRVPLFGGLAIPVALSGLMLVRRTRRKA